VRANSLTIFCDYGCGYIMRTYVAERKTFANVLDMIMCKIETKHFSKPKRMHGQTNRAHNTAADSAYIHRS